MVLSDKEIRDYCQNWKNLGLKSPIVEPFSENRIRGASYDLGISDIIHTLRGEFRVLSANDQISIDQSYEEVNLEKIGYVLSPHEFILADIEEHISVPENIAAHIRPRTRFTRLGLIISAQHINPTYEGRLQIGIFNATPFAIRIEPGMCLAQIVFEEMKSIPTDSMQYQHKGNAAYQHEAEFRGAKLSDDYRKGYEEFVRQMLETC